MKLQAADPAALTGHPIVVLAYSAGGLDALTTILASLPAGLPATVIVLQHMSPGARSHLVAILGRVASLPVAEARDGDPLDPGRVLVAPPGQHTLITPQQRVALIPSGSVPPYRPSADLLLTTLALAAGPRVIAVVLSGEGNDAATGATAVHRFGGTVIASTLESSTRPAMPQATISRDDITNHVIAVGDVAGCLLALTTGADRPG
jgi:two-component system, chemotaxis family, protein-glutamate methylesterase/glutaminase